MKRKKVLNALNRGEGISIEFKESRRQMNRDIFKTVCAFLNRNGGELLLGVDDKGRIKGIDPGFLDQLKKNLVTALNNPQKLNPPLYAVLNQVTIENKPVLHLSVPESSQVHRCNGRIYDRSEDGDFDVTDQTDAVAKLYIRKQNAYSENKIYPYVTLQDLRTDLLQRVRKQAKGHRPDHPWPDLSDVELLQSARLFQRDFETGKTGYTLAAVMLFGTDEVIQTILPHYKTDALLRVHNLNRYDDREIVATNLIESYDQLMAFIGKHLSDPFFLEGDQRISLRDKIFREVIANTLIHREFLDHFPAKLIIQKDKVTTENGNKAHGQGIIDPTNYTPFPKNPIIARVFREIGRADELGSGVKNLFRYCKSYSGGLNPQLVEADVFKMIVPRNSVEIKIREEFESYVSNKVVRAPDIDTINPLDDLNPNAYLRTKANKNFSSLIEKTDPLNIFDEFEFKKGMKKKLSKLLRLLAESEGQNAWQYAETMGVSLKSLKRYLKRLKEIGFVEYRGSRKTGGYFISQAMQMLKDIPKKN